MEAVNDRAQILKSIADLDKKLMDPNVKDKLVFYRVKKELLSQLNPSTPAPAASLVEGPSVGGRFVLDKHFFGVWGGWLFAFAFVAAIVLRLILH